MCIRDRSNTRSAGSGRVSVWSSMTTSSPSIGVSSLASSARPLLTVKSPEIVSKSSARVVLPVPLSTKSRSAREITVNLSAFHAKSTVGLPFSRRITPLVFTKPSPPRHEACLTESLSFSKLASRVPSFSVTPVSYTHLDVYKRQQLNCAHDPYSCVQ